jgi:hypothetical protein
MSFINLSRSSVGIFIFRFLLSLRYTHAHFIAFLFVPATISFSIPAQASEFNPVDHIHDLQEASAIAPHAESVAKLPAAIAPPEMIAPQSSAASDLGKVESNQPAIKLESITTDFRNTGDGAGLRNRIIEPTAQFQLRNGDKLRLKTGLDSFRQSGYTTITNVPLQVGWEHKLGEAKLSVAGGVETFNQLPIAPTLQTKLELPIGIQKDEQGRLIKGVVLSGFAEHVPYKFNAKTLHNQIKVTHIKPSLYWQIDKDTSLYTHYQLGLYNDGNVEHQSVSRLERKFGQFFVAANLFTWNYNFNAEPAQGYFSPQDFLTYNGEVGWAGPVIGNLRCRLTANLGQQRLQGSFSNAANYHAGCTVPISSNLEADINYDFSNVRNRTTNNGYQNQSVSGQLRWKF